MTSINKILNHPLLKSSIVYIVTDAINKAIPFFLLPVLTLYLLPSDYSVVTNYNLLAAIIVTFVGLSTHGAISASYFKLSKRELSKYISNALLLITASFMIIGVLIYIFKEAVYSYVKIPIEFQFAALLTAFCQSITSINLSLWRLEEKAFKFGSYQISQTIVNLGLSLLFIISLGLSWKGRIYGIFIANITFGLFSLIIIAKRRYLTLDFNTLYFKDLIYFGIPLIPHGVSLWIRSGIDRVFITSMIGDNENGIYATGLQFGLLMTFLIIGVNNAFSPFLFKNLSVNTENKIIEIKKKLVKFSYFLMAGYFLLCFILTIISLLVVDFLLAKNYQESKNIVFWALLSQTFQGMYLLVVNYIFFVKKTKLLAVITLSCSFIHVIQSYFFIRNMGIMGAAYSSVIVSMINFVAVWIYSNKVYPMPWFTVKPN